jgi:nucleoid-associated protein YgaU
MGMFDFVASAGEKLAKTVSGDDAASSINDTVEVTQDRLDTLRTENIVRNLAALDIDGEQVSVTVKVEVATLEGTAPSQEALEKLVLCAGNQHGISSVDCRLTLPAAEPQASGAELTRAAETPNFYTVKSGDTLGKIAQEQYGSASKYTVIFEANQPMLKDPDHIYPGQALRIPAP